jgi:quinol monooxygenase YgiN
MQLRRVRLLIALATLALASAAWSHRVSASEAETMAAPQRTGVHDFDFLMGDWRVRHRVKPRGSAEWNEFEGDCGNRALAGGAANVEEHRFERPTGVTYGIAARAYDAKSGQWAIWWIDSRDPHLPMDPPMKGQFGEDGVGLFYSEYLDDGKPMRVRFIWSQITPVSARWEQAFSADAGKTWDTNWTMDFRRKGAACCSVFELRQYTLKPQQRDALIELFEREFVETQEAEGMRLFGQFRDLDDPDRLVWIRAFADMPARERALTGFYSGPTWKQYGRQAAATMIDSDNVLLLRPVHQASSFVSAAAARPPVNASTASTAAVSALVYHLDPDAAAEFPAFFRDAIAPRLREAGIEPIASFATESAVNTYPQLPVREGEHVFVWLARFDSVDAQRRAFERLAQSASWTSLAPALARQLKAPTQQLRLQPTARSLLQ